MSKRIAKQRKQNNKLPFKKDEKGAKLPLKKILGETNDRNIVFSLERLDINDYFNIECTCPTWCAELIELLSAISTVTRKTFTSDRKFRNGTYRIHSLKGATPPVKIPSDVEFENLEQIRLSKTKGGIHGILVEHVFYIIWLDPLHNMYPNDRYGGLKKIKPPSTCCNWQEEELRRLAEENTQLKELFDKI